MNRNSYGCRTPDIRDYGSEPLIVNIDCFTKQNPYYRTALWTGKHLQVTLMSIPVHGDIGLEIHSDVDQFIRIEDGCALVMMGKNKLSAKSKQQLRCNHSRRNMAQYYQYREYPVKAVFNLCTAATSIWYGS